MRWGILGIDKVLHGRLLASLDVHGRLQTALDVHAGILAALSVHGGLLNALSVCGRLLSALNVRGRLIAALVIHGGLLEGPDPCLLDNGGLGRQIYMINSVHFNNMTTRNQEQYQDWYLEWER